MPCTVLNFCRLLFLNLSKCRPQPAPWVLCYFLWFCTTCALSFCPIVPLSFQCMSRCSNAISLNWWEKNKGALMRDRSKHGPLPFFLFVAVAVAVGVDVGNNKEKGTEKILLWDFISQLFKKIPPAMHTIRSLASSSSSSYSFYSFPGAAQKKNWQRRRNSNKRKRPNAHISEDERTVGV